MEFKQYPSYKDSGVEWLGKVPKHWNVMQLKSAIKNWRNGKWGIDINHSQEGNLICVRVADFDRKKGVISEDKLTFRNYKNESIDSCLLNENHILIERSGGGDKQLVGATVRYTLEDKQAVCSNFISLLCIDKNIFNVKYMQYSFEHFYYLGVNRLSIKQTSGIQNLDLKQYIQNNFSFPQYWEQGKIVDFLDVETTRIDNLIAKQEKLIELLEEQRKSIISHAVTKGLNPDVPMKDSGVEWLGEVPEHWAILKNRHVFKFNKGLTITKEDLIEIGIPCVSYGEIHSKLGFEFDPKNDDMKYVSDDYLNTDLNSLIKQGDFIFADTSEDFEGSGNFSYLNANATAFAGYHTIIARLKSNQNPRFMAYLFDSKSHRKQIQTAVKGIKVFSITQGILKDIYVWLPSYEEQNSIVKFLDNQVQKIYTLKLKQNELIQKLKEYRSSIISHAVTGKIDIRENTV